MITACDAPQKDASGLVVPGTSGNGPTLVIPVCRGERVVGATYWVGEAYAAVDLRGVLSSEATSATTVDLDMSITALTSGALAPGAEMGHFDPALAGVGFYELDTVEVETTGHMVRMSPGTLDPTDTLQVRWDYPFGRNDPVATPVAEPTGRDDLLDGCGH